MWYLGIHCDNRVFLSSTILAILPVFCEIFASNYCSDLRNHKKAKMLKHIYVIMKCSYKILATQ